MTDQQIADEVARVLVFINIGSTMTITEKITVLRTSASLLEHKLSAATIENVVMNTLKK